MNTALPAQSFTRTFTASKARATLPPWASKSYQAVQLQFLLSGVKSLKIIFPGRASRSEWSTLAVTPVGFSFSVWKRSMRATIGGLVVLLVAAFAAACGGIPKTFYYTLQVPAAPAPTDTKTTYVLGVEHFRAPEMLRDDRMVYFESPTQVNFYEHHRWSADPATLLSEYTDRKSVVE